MKTIISGIKSIVSFFDLLLDFVTSFISNIGTMVSTVAKAVASIPEYFNWLPGEVLTVLLALISLVVIYKVLGR